LRKEVPILRVLLLAFVLLVLWQPLSVHAVGFWLSFGAVALLILWSGMSWQGHKIKQFIRLQWWLTLALIPMTLGFFGLLSWVAPLANIIAIPMVGLMIVPLALMGLGLGFVSSTLQSVCWSLAITLVDALNAYLGYLSQIPHAQQVWVLSGVSLIFLSAVLAAWLLPKGILPRILTPILCVANYF
jgi:competence protein ComEC